MALAGPTGGFAPAERVWAVIFPFVRSCLTCGRSAATPETLCWPAIGDLRRLTLIEGLADGLREEHDEAAEPKPTFVGSHRSVQKLAGYVEQRLPIPIG
jgi:hypothetical protein